MEVLRLANSKEFTRLMNRLDDVQERFGKEFREIRHELNLAVINGTINNQKRRVKQE